MSLFYLVQQNGSFNIFISRILKSYTRCEQSSRSNEPNLGLSDRSRLTSNVLGCIFSFPAAMNCTLHYNAVIEPCGKETESRVPSDEGKSRAFISQRRNGCLLPLSMSLFHHLSTPSHLCFPFPHWLLQLRAKQRRNIFGCGENWELRVGIQMQWLLFKVGEQAFGQIYLEASTCLEKFRDLRALITQCAEMLSTSLCGAIDR